MQNLSMRPKCLYKYREISPEVDLNSLHNEELFNYYNIKALFNSYATLSSRKKFQENDENDSRIKLLEPQKHKLKLLLKHCPSDRKEELKSCVGDKMSLNSIWKEKIKNLAREFEKMVDSYAIYCLASSVTNTYMWENYASDHTGFCIEFRDVVLPRFNGHPFMQLI